jgi:hypothetical protein
MIVARHPASGGVDGVGTAIHGAGGQPRGKVIQVRADIAEVSRRPGTRILKPQLGLDLDMALVSFTTGNFGTFVFANDPRQNYPRDTGKNRHNCHQLDERETMAANVEFCHHGSLLDYPLIVLTMSNIGR